MEQSDSREKQIFLDLIRKFENNPEKFVLLAGIYRGLGDTDRAISILQSGLKADRSNASAKILLGEILYDRWLIDETKKYLEDSIETYPNNEKALDILYNIYYSEENFEKALEILYSRLVFCKNKKEVLRNIDSINSRLGNAPRISDLSKNIRAKLNQISQPEQPQKEKLSTDEAMADQYINQGNYGRAVEILEELIKKNPSDIHLRTRLSLCQASKMFGKNFIDNKKGI